VEKIMCDDDIKQFADHFDGWLLKDIRIVLGLEDYYENKSKPDRRSLNCHKPFVAAVILTCCGIDTLAKFRYGQLNGNVGVYFKKLIKDYFPKKYNSDDIYCGLRNYLVHGYSLNPCLGLKHQDRKLHLKNICNRTIIDVYCFYEDLEKAFKKYNKQLLKGLYRREFILRWKLYPLISHRPC